LSPGGKGIDDRSSGRGGATVEAAHTTPSEVSHYVLKKKKQCFHQEPEMKAGPVWCSDFVRFEKLNCLDLE